MGGDDRARGLMLTTLDFTDVMSKTSDSIRAAKAALEVEDVDQLIVSFGFGPYAMAEADGKLYVVCHEGVGWEITDEDPLHLGVYVNKPGYLAIAPEYMVHLAPEEVRACATTEQIDLADLVRRFGARLEQNFWLWHHTLRKER
jgi:hypothetical protein